MPGLQQLQGVGLGGHLGLVARRHVESYRVGTEPGPVHWQADSLPWVTREISKSFSFVIFFEEICFIL